MRHSLLFYAILGITLALVAMLLPVSSHYTDADRERLALLKVEYKYVHPDPEQDFILHVGLKPLAVLLDTPKIEIEDGLIGGVTKRIQRRPALQTLTNLKEQTFSPRLAQAGYVPSGGSELLSDGSRLTVYEPEEKPDRFTSVKGNGRVYLIMLNGLVYTVSEQEVLDHDLLKIENFRKYKDALDPTSAVELPMGVTFAGV